MRIIFMGTSGFALPSLKKLAENHDVISVFTKKDKPRGRGMRLKEGVIKKEAKRLKIEVKTPENLLDKKIINYLKDKKPDLMVVVSYGLKIPENILKIPKYFVINAHASLLPKYRGASPINKAILEGDKKTGITVFKLDKNWDAGDIIETYSVEIDKNETAESLWDKLRNLSAEALLDSIEKIKNNDYEFEKQDESKATYAYKINKKDAKINWNKTIENIDRQIRGYYSWPGAFSYYKNKRMKILSAVIEKKDINEKPGTVVDLNSNKGIGVAANNGVVYIKKLKLAGKKAMDYIDFLNGYDISKGEILG